MQSLILALVATLVVSTQIGAQMESVPSGKLKQIAVEALKDVVGVGVDEDFKTMGFESASEARDAIVGEPLRICTIRLDELQKYSSGQDPRKLLHCGNRVLYPVLVAKAVRSSVAVENNEGQWSAASVGSANLMKMLADAWDEKVKATGLPPSSFFAVHVPALYLYFIGHNEGGLMLTPVSDEPAYGLKVKESMPADRVLMALVPGAKEHSDSPR